MRDAETGSGPVTLRIWLCNLFVHGRYGDCKCRALADLAFYVDRSPKQLSKALRNRKSQSSSLLHGALRLAFDLTVLVEESSEFVGGDAFAGIAN